MNRIFKKAFTQLQALGCPVFQRDDHDGFFVSGEETSSSEWADYYNARADWQYETTNPKLDQVLHQHGLFAEWENPSCLIVHIA